jgi:hypothetical protein
MIHGARPATPQHDVGRTRRLWRTGLIVSALLLMVVLATACSRDSNGPGVAGQGASSTPSASPSGDAGDGGAFARCMREHGINIPDLVPGVEDAQDSHASEPGWDDAFQACQSLMQADNGPEVWVPSPQELEQLLSFAACMRVHGIQMSDPDPTTGDMTAPGSIRAEQENDPLYQAAYAACKDKLPNEVTTPEKNR